MEFQEAITRVIFHDPVKNGVSSRDSVKEKRKPRWKIVISRSSSSSPRRTEQQNRPPKEFICPISESLMADPVIVSSGHSFERACVQACNTLGFTPTLYDDTIPNFTSVIPNLALKTTVSKWCEQNSINPPKPLDFFAAENLVRSRMETQMQKQQKDQNFSRKKGDPGGESARKDRNETQDDPTQSFSSSSADSTRFITVSTPPLQLKTRPSCYSSPSSSSEMEMVNANESEEEVLVNKLKSPQVYEVEEGLILLRKITRTKEEARLNLCTQGMMSALQPLIKSKYITVQVNSTACIVNLSLEKSNRIKIVRSGIVPLLIDVLKGGFPEAQEHACGAMFSLALDDVNKTAIGVLGALPPLLYLLRGESERTRNDSALALYHLSLVQSNRSKLVRIGSVQILLGMLRLGQMVSRVLLVLCNLASCVEGRAAMLDSGGVECLVGLLRGDELESESTRDSCLSALYVLSHGGLRFRGLAKAAGAEEVLSQVVKTESEKGKEKIRIVLEKMRVKAEEEDEEAEDVDWAELLDSGPMVGKSRWRLGRGKDESSGVNSSEF